MQPSSTESLHRLRLVMDKIKPTIVAIQCTPNRLLSAMSKQITDQHLESLNPSLECSDVEMAYGLAYRYKAETVPIDLTPENIMSPPTHTLFSYLNTIRLHYRVPSLPRVLPSFLGKTIYKSLHLLQLRSRMSQDSISVADYRFARRIYGIFFPKESNAALLMREAIMVDNLKKVIRNSVAAGRGGETIAVVIGKVHAEGLFNAWNSYGKGFIAKPGVRGLNLVEYQVKEVEESRLEVAIPSQDNVVMVGRTVAAPTRRRVAATVPELNLPFYMRPLGGDDQLATAANYESPTSKVMKGVQVAETEGICESPTKPNVESQTTPGTPKPYAVQKKPGPSRPGPRPRGESRARGIQYID
ncbi:hypothetical protein HDU67_005349 [Dinochytrium kinnereticum]|nr:hypothetical protein HDU67_005349 [Dinochytrium kinnereticum]